MAFSRKQQQILGIVCLLYWIWLFSFVYADAHNSVQPSQLVKPDPPELVFYIEPPVDINTGNSEELQLLPSIGPVLAKRIIAYRERHGPFTSVDSLRNIRGIGPKTVQKLRYYLEF
jgi:competence ComEA-like helix-hairpin-helix protein